MYPSSFARILTFRAASGIGKACCLAFAKDGARGILVADLNLEGAQETAVEAEQVATNPDFRAEAIHADVTIPESLEAAIDHASRSFGRIDYGVHSAGVSSVPLPSLHR